MKIQYRASFTLAFIAATLAVLAPGRAMACDTPVFRYALERWEPYHYETVVFHDEPLSAAMQETLEEIQQRPLNMQFTLVDLNRNSMHDDIRALWEKEKARATPPWAVTLYPPQEWRTVATNHLWSGALEESALWRIVDSPARRTLAEHLLQGVSAVWVLIEGDDPDRNDAAYDALSERLDWIEKEVELPELAVQAAAEGELGPEAEGYVPLKIDFEIIRLGRDNDEEAFFVNSLLRTEVDYKDFKSQPFAFPIFGQGRAIWGLIGDGINERMIDEASTFMLGPCSCQVKALNPGTDMLVQADWYGGVANLLSIPAVAPTLVGTTLTEEDLAASAETETGAEDDAAPDPAARSAPIGQRVAAAIGILLVAVTLVTVKLLQSNQNRE